MRKRRLKRSPRRVIRTERTFVLRSNFKRNQSIKRFFKLGLYFVLFGAVVFGAVKGWIALEEFVSKNELLKIKKIEVYGNKNISKGEILALLPFETGDNIFSVDLSKAEKDILKLKPELKKIRINRRIKKIVITINERKPVGVVNINGSRLGIDYDNKPFPLRGEYIGAVLPEIIALNDSDREEILGFVKIIQDKAKDFFDKAVSFYYESLEDSALKLNNGTRIIWGRTEKDKFDLKLQKLKEVLDDTTLRFHSIDYINLNYLDSGRVLVKPKSVFNKQNSAERIQPAKGTLNAVR